jgi:molybdenum cofactor cytidylyltransferase
VTDAVRIPARTIAVLLAGGRSQRMGRCKQTLPWSREGRPTTVVAAAYDTVATVADEVVVTVGRHATDIIAALEGRPATIVDVDADGTMLDSARAGIRAALAADADRIVLHLSDHPAVATTTVRHLVDAAEEADYVHPRRGDRGGHPVILSRAIASCILEASLPDGLRSARDLPGFRIQAVDLDDAGVQIDLDTPEDWRGGSSSE